MLPRYRIVRTKDSLGERCYRLYVETRFLWFFRIWRPVYVTRSSFLRDCFVVYETKQFKWALYFKRICERADLEKKSFPDCWE